MVGGHKSIKPWLMDTRALSLSWLTQEHKTIVGVHKSTEPWFVDTRLLNHGWMTEEH